jgi:hypothetical protein
VLQPHFEGSVRSPLTLPKMGLESPLGLPKIQSSIAGVKTPRLEVFCIPLKRPWSVDVQNGLAWVIWNLQHKLWSKEGPGIGNRPDPDVCRWSATRCWKALEESYKFASNLIPIGGPSKELWAAKVSGVQTRTISGLPFESPETNSHLDVIPMEWRRIYYMGEGGGFPRVQAVVSQVSPELPMACPNTKKGAERVLTNLWLVLNAGSSN